MKKSFFVVLAICVLLSISACSKSMTSYELETAQKFCANKGGIYSIKPYYFLGSHITVVCSDGASTSIPDK